MTSRSVPACSPIAELMSLSPVLHIAVELINEMENDIDTFIVDAEIALEIADQMGPGDVGIGELHLGGRLVGNEPLMLEPDLQRLHLEADTGQELLLVHDHDVPSSRGLNAFLSHLETNSSSSGSGPLGKTTFSFTSSSP